MSGRSLKTPWSWGFCFGGIIIEDATGAPVALLQREDYRAERSAVAAARKITKAVNEAASRTAS